MRKGARIAKIRKVEAMIVRSSFFNDATRFLSTGAGNRGSFGMILRTPPEPTPPPVKEPAKEPEDPHAPVQEPDPDPIRPAQI